MLINFEDERAKETKTTRNVNRGHLNESIYICEI